MFFEQAREQAEQDFQADDKNAQVLQLCADLPSVENPLGRSMHLPAVHSQCRLSQRSARMRRRSRGGVELS